MLLFILCIIIVVYLGPVIYMAYKNHAYKKLSLEEACERGKALMTGGYVKREEKDSE